MSSSLKLLENLGRAVLGVIEQLGYAFALLVESIYWVLAGKIRRQPVRLTSIFREIMSIGVHAIPIISALSFAIGVMPAIQGIETLRVFGAESQVVLGIALSVTREFSPLIVSILVAGRSGSAVTARIGTAHWNYAGISGNRCLASYRDQSSALFSGTHPAWYAGCGSNADRTW